MRKMSLHSYLIFVFCLLISLGQLQRIEVGRNIAIYAHELLMLLWIVGGVFSYPQLWQKNLKSLQQKILDQKLLLWGLVWIGIGWVGAAFSDLSLIKPSLYLLRASFYLGLFFHLKILITQKQITPQNIQHNFLMSGLLILFFGFLQITFLPDLRWLRILGWDDHLFRLTSTVFDPGFTGLILVITLFLWQSNQILKTKLVKLTGSFLISLGVVLTYSRASYLSLIFYLIFSLFFFHRSKFTQRIPIFALSLMPFLWLILKPNLPGEGVNLARTSTVQARTITTIEGLSNLKPREWLTGRGLLMPLYQIEPVKNIPHHAQLPDNSLLLILGGTGLIGTITWLLLFTKYLSVLWQKKNIFLSILGSLIIHSFFSASLTHPFIWIFMIGSWWAKAKSD